MANTKRKDRRQKELIEAGRKAKATEEQSQQLAKKLDETDKQLRLVTEKRDHAAHVAGQRRGLVGKLLQRIRDEVAKNAAYALRVLEMEDRIQRFGERLDIGDANLKRIIELHEEEMKQANEKIVQLKKDGGEAPKLRRRLQTRTEELAAAQTEVHKLKKRLEQ